MKKIHSSKRLGRLKFIERKFQVYPLIVLMPLLIREIMRNAAVVLKNLMKSGDLSLIMTPINLKPQNSKFRILRRT